MNTFIISKKFIPLALICTAMALLVYIVAQQAYRHAANDPQIQIAEDLAFQLNSGRPAATLDSPTKTLIESSLSPFILIYDLQGSTTASTGSLNGVVPTVPLGVFEAAKEKGQHRVTWQPQKDLRIALVVAPYKDGYVAAGRSMRETEARTDSLVVMIVLTWMITLLVTFCIIYLFERKEKTLLK